MAPGYCRAPEAVSLGLCHCCKLDKELSLFSTEAVPPPSQRWETEQFWGWAGLVKWRFSLHVLLVPGPWLSKGSRRLWALHWVPEEEQPWGSWKMAKNGILITKSGSLPAVGCWGLAWMWCSQPSLSLPRPWTVDSVSGPSFALSCSPRKEGTQGNYCWSYQKQVLCRFFSWKSARRSAGGHNAWSILALNQKDHRKVDCMVAFTGLGGLRVRHAVEE